LKASKLATLIFFKEHLVFYLKIFLIIRPWILSLHINMIPLDSLPLWRLFLFKITNGISFLQPPRPNAPELFSVFHISLFCKVLMQFTLQFLCWSAHQNRWGFICVTHLSYEVTKSVVQIHSMAMIYYWLFKAACW
jgi:hypothetical protein